MKRWISFISCVLFVFTIAGCHVNNVNGALSSGIYYMVGEYEEYLTPYLRINAEDNTFSLGQGAIVSYAERGSFEIQNGKVVATSQSATYIFEIKDSKTLILVDSGANEFFKLPENVAFILSEDIH